MGRHHPRGERGGGSKSRSSGGVPAKINVGKGGGGAEAAAGASGDNHKGNLPQAQPQANDAPFRLSPESISLAQLRQKSISHPLQQCQLTVYVPPHTVGAIIGRGGRTILNVQREAMRRSAGHVAPVRISVMGSNNNNHGGNSSSGQQQGGGNNHKQGQAFPASQAGPSSPTWSYRDFANQKPVADDPAHVAAEDLGDDDQWAPVIIRGDPVGALAAARLLFPIVERSHDPHVVLEIPVHRAKHNALVGRGGTTIAALSATYGPRIMVPPNEFMSNVDVGTKENFWQQRLQKQQQQVADAGASMLFGNGGPGATGTATPGAAALPPNIIQLEGEVEKVELCLVKMLSIVAGERWVPTGVIVENPPAEAIVDDDRSDEAPDSGTAKNENSGVPGGRSRGGGGGGAGTSTAESVIIKIWTPSSKLLNLGKIRKVQRRTNTIIRRKKLRLSGQILESVIQGGCASGNMMIQEKEEDGGDEDSLPQSPENEGENDDEDGAMPKEPSFEGAKTATKYIITGKTEAVRSATAQFEKILGLKPGSSAVIDTTYKTSRYNRTTGDGAKEGDGTVGGGAQHKPDGDTENFGGGGGGGKKPRKKKKRGKGGAKEGSAPPLASAERGDSR